jgi:hypothetical protein
MKDHLKLTRVRSGLVRAQTVAAQHGAGTLKAHRRVILSFRHQWDSQLLGVYRFCGLVTAVQCGLM